MAIDTENHILPRSVAPRHYDLHIHNVDLSAPWAFDGQVSIECQCLQDVTAIVLNGRDLTVATADINGVPVREILYDAESRRITLELANALRADEDATIHIAYSGRITNSMAGFYRSRYRPAAPPAASVPHDEESHYHYSTQFEACDARRAFPCFDEPAWKATFTLSVEAPSDQVVLSNMPVAETTAASTRPGWQVTRFERTPVMSTYLLAWAIGDFEYVECFTDRTYGGKSIPFRIYTTKGLKHRAMYALQYGPRIIDYYSDLFGVEYPLPHVQCLAVSEFSHNAMENWGLVLYREASLLCDDETSDAKRKFIVYVLGHEMAHQWFGDLVTMQWWSSLWLNEGFATWVGWHAVDHVHPEWNVWEEFTFQSGDTVLQLDSLRSSHPIEIPVRNALEVDQVFDAISYYKGCYIIRMLAKYLGEETFLRGVSLYLQRHAYANATTNDLWVSVSEASGQDIGALIDAWILKIGYPVLTVIEQSGNLKVQQSRFLSSGDVKAEDDATTWWIPLQLRSGTESQNISLHQKIDVIPDVSDDFYKINSFSVGCYRVNYPPDRLAKLGQQLHRLDGSDKIGLINDISALAFSGDATTSALLSFTENCKHETSFYVWSSIINALNKVQNAFASSQVASHGLRTYLLELVEAQLGHTEWNVEPEDSFVVTQMRSLILSTAGTNGNSSVIDEAKRRFAARATDPSALPSSLRSTIYALAVQNGSRAEYDQLVQEWQETTTIDGRQNIYQALGYLRDPELIAQYLELLFTAASTQDIHFGALSLSTNPDARPLLWRYIRTNFDAILSKHGDNLMIIDRLLLMALRHFSDRETAEQIREFFANRDTKGYDRTISITLDTIASRAAYRERDVGSVERWLREKQYA